MKRARFTEKQIIAVLKEHEAGAKTAATWGRVPSAGVARKSKAVRSRAHK